MAEVRRCSSLLKKLPIKEAQNVESKIELVPAMPQEEAPPEVGKLVPRHPAPNFCAQAVLGGKIQEVSLLDYEGKWLVLLFSPLGDPIEREQILAFSDSIKSFQERGAERSMILDLVCRSVSIDDDGRGWRAEQWVYDSLRKLQELSDDEPAYGPREKQDAHDDAPVLEEKEGSHEPTQETYENAPDEEENPSEPLAANQMIVVVKGPSYQEVHFKVKKSTTFKQIIASYCKEMDLDVNRVKFSFQGERVFKDLSPPEVGMTSGDRLYCYKIRC
ncbi:hypothetical protein BSKO_13812 [Bryopsis sp. KO-2023]|nr:hypothetical protein BSKO_13812 [Bryopsis sp. KO-2023]